MKARRPRALALGFLLLASSAALLRAQDEAEEPSQARMTEAELLQAVKEKLQGDPGFSETLAQRINRSSLAGKISPAPDKAARLKDVRRWIEDDPDTAAGIALGLAKDDAEGSRRFEDYLNRTVRTRLVENPGAAKNIFGRLKKASGDSKLMRRDEEMTDEEQNEILKTLFEGKGSQSNQVITQMEHEGLKRAPQGGTPGAALNSGYYDRLSQGNLGGYSPQLQALQSALNLRRVPGAPKLIETGKLDYETLSYPAYGMRYDIANLERRLRLERNFALAKLLGRERGLGPEQLLDPEIEAGLKAQAASKGKLNPRFERRQAALERAAAAARAFEAAALPSRDPARISRGLLVSLGLKQKEAARWLTVASLEEELERLQSEEGFLSPELLEAIARAPVDEASRAAYRRRGEEFKKSLSQLKANDETAIQTLESEGWLASLDRVDQALSRSSLLRKDLGRNIADFVKTPYALSSLAFPKPRWREILDRLFKRLLPSSAYAGRLKQADAERELLKDAFLKIATGNLDAAHAILTQHQPSGGPRSRR